MKTIMIQLKRLVGGWDNIQLRPVVLRICQSNFKILNKKSYEGII